jgi:hypothetical protein
VLDKATLKDMIEAVEEQNRYAISVYSDLQAFQSVVNPLAAVAV